MSLQPRFPKDTPFADFSHCPRCGAAAVARLGERAIRCMACGFEFYFNCASAVGGLLLYQGKLVLGVRAQDPQKGMLDMPGGFVEFDESAEDALRREVMEELQLEIFNPVYLASAPNNYFYGGILYKTTDLYFVCEVGDISTIKAGDDVAGYELADPADLDPQRLAFASARIALRQLLQRLPTTSLA